MVKPLIVAEFGSSPAPDWDFYRWCQIASFAGADAVKIQIWRHDHFPFIEQNEKRKVEFPRRKWFDFVEVAHSYDLLAGASVFDNEAVDIVAKDGDFIKLAAREQGNKKLLDDVLTKREKYIQVYRSISEGKFWGHNYDSRTIHLATIQEYPTPLLTAVKKLITWAKFFNGLVEWGWSSHTNSVLDCWFAAKLGASVIEKHFCLDPKNIEAGHSLLPKNFQRMVKLCKS